MGFEMQLHEILHRLPTTRQTLLYSATLPKSLVEFAKAGLVNPKLIRLDAETKISSDLRMGFLTVKPNEKEAALLCLLKDVIGVPFTTEAEMEKMEREDVDMESGSESDGEGAHKGKKPYKKRERMPKHTAPHQTLIFTATKHHVEYLTTLLRTAGYSTSHIYGSLDQVARKQQMDRFRRGRASILVVTDVAARGIDIPVLENVVNYDFPTGSRIFVHRVGRTARAGRQGWAWSFVTNTELPYLLDLQLFLGRPLISAKESTGEMDEYTSSLMLGSLPRDPLDAEVEYINTTLVESAQNLPILKEVTRKGQAMYERSQGKASQESYRRAKEMMKDQNWGLAGSSVEATSIHPRFRGKTSSGVVRSSGGGNTDANMAQAKAALLARINSFTPTETVFEVGTRGKTPGAQLMQERRKTIANVNKKAVANRVANGEREKGAEEEVVEDGDVDMQGDLPMADENDLEVSVPSGSV
jgi:ATP-dependent RNA helicase DDX54/DBP10